MPSTHRKPRVPLTPSLAQVLGPKGQYIKIISKVENHEGVSNFDEILAKSGGCTAPGQRCPAPPAAAVFCEAWLKARRRGLAGWLAAAGARRRACSRAPRASIWGRQARLEQHEQRRCAQAGM